MVRTNRNDGRAIAGVDWSSNGSIETMREPEGPLDEWHSGLPNRPLKLWAEGPSAPLQPRRPQRAVGEELGQRCSQLAMAFAGARADSFGPRWPRENACGGLGSGARCASVAAEPPLIQAS